MSIRDVMTKMLAEVDMQIEKLFICFYFSWYATRNWCLSGEAGPPPPPPPPQKLFTFFSWLSRVHKLSVKHWLNHSLWCQTSKVKAIWSVLRLLAFNVLFDVLFLQYFRRIWCNLGIFSSGVSKVCFLPWKGQVSPSLNQNTNGTEERLPL